MIVISINNSQDLARKIARKLKAKYAKCHIDQFPDGDIHFKLGGNVKGKNVILVNSFQPLPNWSLYCAVFAAETAKDLGAKKVTLVAPYLAFMRQDKRFHSGEAISSLVMAKMLNNSIDKLVTIDPHLHRYKSLKDIFKISTKKLTANNLIADYVKKIKNVVIIGPDWESYQWAEAIAKRIGVSCTVLEKKRFSSRHVHVRMKNKIDVKGKNVVIVDDIISTGNTIMQAAKKAKKLGAKKVIAIGVHGLFVEKGYEKLKKLGVKVVTTNTVKHKSNKIDVGGLVASTLNKKNGEKFI
jgi:ribose-phosphate pyrophosphokinase